MEDSTTTWGDLDELEAVVDAKHLNYLPRLDPAEADENAYTEDRVAGRVVGIYTKTNDRTQATYPVVQLLLRDGRVVNVHASRTVLKRELEGVAIGAAVLIEYQGLVERENAASYHSYKVLVRSPQAAALEVPAPIADDLGEWGAEA